MKVQVIQDAEVLLPNKDHKNFTMSGEIIEEGTVLNGNEQYIVGLKKGKPFTYRLFKTNNNKLIFLNKIKPMETTEVTLGADSQVSPTEVNFAPAENFTRVKVTGMLLGAIAGFAYAKYAKHDMKKMAMFIGVGAVAGYFTGVLIDRKNNVIKVNTSK